MIEKNETEIMKNWSYTEPPLMTVACITYNHESYISDALDGILMQETDFPFEVIVHDDCSIDKTVEILEKYVKEYPTIIKLILQKENQWSKGIMPGTTIFNRASGKYIAICEGDDYWIDPHKLQIQLDEMRKVEDCQMSFHSAIDQWEDGSKKDSITTKQANGNRLFSTSEIVLGGGGFCPTASLIFEKEAVLNLPQWYEEAPFGDYFLQIFGSIKGGALYIDRPMSVYRRNAAGSWSVSMLNIENKEKEFQRILKSYNDMDSYFNQQFHAEILQIKSELYLEMALSYLISDDIIKFKQTVKDSYSLTPKRSKKLLLSYYLRSFPTLLKGMSKLYRKLNKYIAFKG
ncbi:glycosyltransferase [Sulfurovum sp. XGS-02]|uniref:glycosyltransferase n=1 Tax=Sulfurovum sp. XGS-02 TaxID=2925411 RepID=UPI002050E2C8|nr:glycosyltransferase [Sulfurovum sp. XGS-02]UPT76813.1 glycosyltransferase [Sulfurovum sp. XGS-02]